MHQKLKSFALVLCLFVFLFLTHVLHLTPGAGLIDALCGTALIIFTFNRWGNAHCGDEWRREGPVSKIVSLRKRS